MVGTLTETVGDGPRRGEARPRRRGELVGRFVILERLGTGGMGVVYSAYDPELDRKVALKLLHRDSGHGPLASEGREKLVHEAQALARVVHPNVVGVHDVGEHEGDVFLALEFVDGRTLKEWRQEQERSVEEIVDVFVAAGRGVAAVHRVGIVHRDFKPDNVLVGHDGRVRVTDFGLALDSPEGRFTTGRDPWASGSAAAQLRADARRANPTAGTLAYMAPEQHLGLELDARCDQFSYSVALWEALYGTHPFESDSMSGLVFNVIEGDPSSPPGRAKIPSWMVRVLQRGLQRRPDARFESMDALLDALGDDPALARARWLRWGGGAVFGGAVVAVASLMLGRSTPDPCEGARDKLEGVWDDARRAELQEAVLGTQVPYAEHAWSKTEAIATRYADEWVDAHVEVCRATRVRGEQSDSLMDARIRCLDGRLGALAALGEQLARADPKAVERAVSAAEGLPPLRRCDDVDYVTSGPSPSDDPERFAEAEELRTGLDQVAASSAMGRYAEALELAQQLWPRADALYDPRLRARAGFALGRALSSEGSWPEAEPVLREAFAAARRIDDEELGANAATSLVFLVGRRLARPDEGLAWAEHARIALAKAPDPITRVRLLNAAGGIYLAKDEAKEALEHYSRAFDVAERERPRASYNLGLSLNNMGLAHEDLGQFDEALELYARAEEVFVEALGPGHPRAAMPMSNTAAIHFRRGEYEQAIALGQKVLAIREPVLPEDHPSLSATLNNLGNAMHFAGRSAEALDLLERAHRAIEGRLGPDHPHVAMCLSNLGMVHRALGDIPKALAANRRALEIRQAALGPDHTNVATSHNNLASVLHEMGDTEQALAEYREALAVYERALGPEHGMLAHPLTGIGQMLLALERPEEAVAPLERALALRDDDSPAHEVADSEFALARALLRSGGDESRARSLGEAARGRYATAAVPRAEEHRETIERWLATLGAEDG